MSPEPSPAPLARPWLRLAVIVGGAAGAGLLLQSVLTAHLDAIADRASSDMIGARRELARLFRVCAVAVFGMTGCTGIALLIASLRAVRLAQFPPPGMLRWGGATGSVHGPRARVLAGVGAALAVLLVLCSLAGSALVWAMASALEACRAR
jgi:hypothetical protein